MTQFIIVISMMFQSFTGSNITSELLKEMEAATADQKISCIVFMKETYPYETMKDLSVHERITAFRNIAHQSQISIIDWLSTIPGDAEIKQRYWVFNGFHVTATSQVIMALAQRDDVGWISHNGEVHIIAEPTRNPAVSSRAIEWNIQKIMADSCWTAGFTGQGIILGETDTGVEYTHPAISGKWAGYWHVATGLPPSNTPYDDHGHGTHCMGTIMGGDGFGPFTDDIGVAYEAQFVAAKVLNSGGSGSYDQCAEGLQFMADLKDSVDVMAVSNSWAGSNAADTFFYPLMRTYISINILPVFANANTGPNPGTVGCPGSYSNVVGVGATDSNDDIANFSSRGPAPNQPPFNDPSTWLRDDWNLTKPQISAPGVNIRSCLPGGGYASWNGTSMATPHVCGAVGIICQKNPILTPKMLYSILLDNVDEPPQGAPYPNNDYGWGRLNVWKSLNGTPTVNQPWISILDKTIDQINPGETGQIVVTVKNIGGADAYNTTGTLKSYDNYVTISNETYVFGDLAPDDTASNTGSPYLFTAHPLTPEGHEAKLGLIIHADGEHDTLDFDDTVFYKIQIGTSPAPTVIHEDDFEYGGGIDSFPDYWDATGNWHRVDSVSHSPIHSAYSGEELDNATTLTLKNAVDLTTFSNPQLGFWHRYDFESGIFMDEAAVQVSTDGGSSWNNLWQYDWLSGNSIPWTEETYALPSSNNVKIRYLIDGYTFFQDYTDWLIDDFKIFTPTDNEPPYFTNTTIWPDTNYTGPFLVRSTITDVSGVDIARLYYRINSGSWQEVNMSPQGNDIYQASIPQQSLSDTINYYLWARDTWINPNSGTDPVGAPNDGYYLFIIGPVGIEEYTTQSIKFMPIANPSRGPIDLKFSIPKKMAVRLVVYDVVGRLVCTLIDKPMAPGDYQVRWNKNDRNDRTVSSGVYFVKFTVGDGGTFEKIDKLILLK